MIKSSSRTAVPFPVSNDMKSTATFRKFSIKKISLSVFKKLTLRVMINRGVAISTESLLSAGLEESLLQWM